jgi:hypothetical protein
MTTAQLQHCKLILTAINVLVWSLVIIKVRTSNKYIKLNFTLEQSVKAHKGSSGISVLVFSLGARWEWVINFTPGALYFRAGYTVLFLQETGWVPGPVWTGEENLASYRASIP